MNEDYKHGHLNGVVNTLLVIAGLYVVCWFAIMFFRDPYLIIKEVMSLALGILLACAGAFLPAKFAKKGWQQALLPFVGLFGGAILALKINELIWR